MTDAILSLNAVSAGYGRIDVLHDVSLDVRPGECVSVIGANGAGKSTLLKVITGQLTARAGTIALQGRQIESHTVADIARRGLRLVPENRQVFANLSVLDNLRLGLYGIRIGQADIDARLENAYQLFPRLKERRPQLAGYLSGGEQQMVAIARAMVSQPQILCLDEPSTGLAPIVVDQIFDSLTALREAGLTLLLVEQLAKKALNFSDRAYVLELGTIVAEGDAQSLLDDQRIEQAYLGGTSQEGTR